MWDLILNPFVTLLTLFYSLFGNNIVIAIIVFTVIVRFLTYPLLSKQQDSAKRMQEVQPQLNKLKEKYKDDREKLAQAQMELYKEQGINPLGGCFPLLIQFPILIGLYQAIFFALAATPFQLVDLSERLLIPGLDGLIPLQNMWLGMDLTQPPTPPINPAYALLLPLLVMGTTYVQSKMTMPAASTGGNDQAAAMTRNMTTIMPIMFGAFALSFSVGLSVYFITSNVVGIIQYSPMGKRVLDQIFGGGDSRKKKNDDDVEDDADGDVKTIEGKASPKANKEDKKASGKNNNGSKNNKSNNKKKTPSKSNRRKA